MRRATANHLRRNLVAWIALFFALTGTGVAASRYIITSTSQIKPSVLKDLSASAAAEKVAAKGAHAIVAHIRSTAPVMTEAGYTVDPLSGSTWTQHAGEVDELVGQVTVTNPTPFCGASIPGVVIQLEGKNIGETAYGEGLAGATEEEPIYWPIPPQTFSTPQAILPLYAPAKDTARTLTAMVNDSCTSGGHFTIASIAIDVIGVR